MGPTETLAAPERIMLTYHRRMVGMRSGQPTQTARRAAAYRAVHQMLEGGAIFKDPLASRILDEQTAASLNEMAADESLRRSSFLPRCYVVTCYNLPFKMRGPY